LIYDSIDASIQLYYNMFRRWNGDKQLDFVGYIENNQLFEYELISYYQGGIEHKYTKPIIMHANDNHKIFYLIISNVQKS